MDVYFGKNKFIGPLITYKKCGWAGKGLKQINTLDLSNGSQVLITVECEHRQRAVRWNRRYQLCKKCAILANLFNSSAKGREITWGNKISNAKKGICFSEEHKKALVEERKNKLMRLRGEEVFSGFASKGLRGRLRNRIGSSIRHKLINRKLSKGEKSVMKCISFSIDELKTHLEAKFQQGMSWNNYGEGGWEIDHIRPDSWFTYSSTDDIGFKESWSLTNLQPLWAADNRSKGNHYAG